jgi:hypothetical protein
MERFVKSSYRRQGLKAQGSKDFMALNSSERDYFMSGVASYMAAKGLNNQIPGEELNELVDDLISTIPDSVSTALPSISGEETKPLRFRLQDKDDVEHVKTDVRICGLLVDDPAAPGTFKFGHKSFMEYLFAATVDEYIKDNNSEKARAILKATDARIKNLVNLPVSIGFLSELIGINSNANANANDVSGVNPAIRAKGERFIANRLLRKIFGVSEKSPFKVFLYFFLFNSAYVRSVRKLVGIQERFVYLTSPLFLCSFFPSLLLVIASIHYESQVMNASAMPFLAFGYILREFSNDSSSLRLWNQICKELCIDDRVLHEVARTSILPWAKNQSFDYFLTKTRSNEGNKS